MRLGLVVPAGSRLGAVTSTPDGDFRRRPLRGSHCICSGIRAGSHRCELVGAAQLTSEHALRAAVGDEAHARLAAGQQDVGLDVAAEQRILGPRSSAASRVKAFNSCG